MDRKIQWQAEWMGAVCVVGREVILCEYKLVLSFYSTRPGQASQDLGVLPRLNQPQLLKKNLDIRLDRQIREGIKPPTICFPLLGSPGYENKDQQAHLLKTDICHQL